MILWSVKMTGCRNARLAGRERELWQLHLFWKPTPTAGSRITAAPIKPGTSSYFTALAEAVAGA